MTNHDLRKQANDLDVTVWVGKSGVNSVVDELNDQIAERNLVKVKFLRAAKGEDSTDDLADELADQINAEVIDVRGNTAVLHR